MALTQSGTKEHAPSRSSPSHGILFRAGILLHACLLSLLCFQYYDVDRCHVFHAAKTRYRVALGIVTAIRTRISLLIP